MNFAALVGLNEIDDVFGEFFVKMFFPYENMLVIKAKVDVVARSQVVSNMAQNSVFAALVMMIGLSFNSEDHDAFLKEWYSGFVLICLIIMWVLFSCVIVKCGF